MFFLHDGNVCNFVTIAIFYVHFLVLRAFLSLPLSSTFVTIAIVFSLFGTFSSVTTKIINSVCSVNRAQQRYLFRMKTLLLKTLTFPIAALLR